MISNEEELYFYMLKNIPDLKQSGEFDVYDAYSDIKEVIFEFKVRRTHYQSLVIEKAKYESVRSVAIELDYTPFYICATPEGVFVFDLEIAQEPNWSTRYMPKTTDFRNRKKILKNVGYLDVCDSIKI